MRRSDRLTSADDFRRVYSQGRRASDGALTAHVLSSGEDLAPRVGITATRGLGGAVQRNRAKRRVRAVVRELGDSIRPGSEVVVTATADAVTADFQQLVDNLRTVLDKVGACR